MLAFRFTKQSSLTDFCFQYALLGSILFLTFIPQSWAQTTASLDNDEEHRVIENLLENYIVNGPRQLFQGTYIYLYEDQVQTTKVRRSLNAQGLVLEEFLSQDTKQKNNSRILNNQYCLLDNGWPYQFHAIYSSFPFIVNNHFQELQKNYTFSVADTETVAGNDAISILIKAKDPYRYGYQLWFEPETATLLKYKLVNQKGQAIEQYLFTDIAIVHHSKLRTNDSAREHEEVKPTSCKQRFSQLTEAFKQFFDAGKIPSGYQAVSYRQGQINETERHARQFQLSDGLSSVSVFIENRGEINRKIKGVMKIGPVTVAGKSIDDYQVTVIGAIPVDSALKFIQSIKMAKP